jgi:hypothetical protein
MTGMQEKNNHSMLMIQPLPLMAGVFVVIFNFFSLSLKEKKNTTN